MKKVESSEIYIPLINIAWAMLKHVCHCGSPRERNFKGTSPEKRTFFCSFTVIAINAILNIFM